MRHTSKENTKNNAYKPYEFRRSRAERFIKNETYIGKNPGLKEESEKDKTKAIKN